MIETGLRVRILGQSAAPSRERRVRLVSALVVGVSVTVFVLLLSGAGLLELWELKTQDLRTNWTLGSAKDLARPDITFIVITDSSIRQVRLEKLG